MEDKKADIFTFVVLTVTPIICLVNVWQIAMLHTSVSRLHDRLTLIQTSASLKSGETTTVNNYVTNTDCNPMLWGKCD